MEWVQNRFTFPLSFLEVTILISATSAWFWNFLKISTFYLGYFPQDLLRQSISSDKICPFALDSEVDGLYVRDFTHHDLPGELLAAKIATFLDFAETPEIILKFIVDQMKISHLFNEVLISPRFLAVFFMIIFAIILIDYFIVGRISGEFIEDYQKLIEIEREETETMQTFSRKFFGEKVLVLGFVISQNFIDISHFTPNLKDFSSFVNSKFSSASITGDSTIFAIWYCFVFFVFYVTQLILMRFVLTLKNGQIKHRNLFSNPPIICTSFLLLILFTFSSFIYGISLMAFNFLNTKYAAILIIDAFQCWIRCAYTLLRVTLIISTSKITTDSEILLKCGNSQRKLEICKIFYEKIAHLLYILQYSLYMVVGITITQKFASILFFRRLAKNIRMFFETKFEEDLDLDKLI
ncbi:unnamed protein product [Caenorhabditis angaria]|uniref:Uncharacterized protein n=1 Tax=Caenorhabditis angaria TaxID=860376 RepID=A0A9P1MTQ7_9PELO|nr:unnamed protein product [Caenorhabditis angaria]